MSVLSQCCHRHKRLQVFGSPGPFNRPKAKAYLLLTYFKFWPQTDMKGGQTGHPTQSIKIVLLGDEFYDQLVLLLGEVFVEVVDRVHGFAVFEDFVVQVWGTG